MGLRPADAPGFHSTRSGFELHRSNSSSTGCRIPGFDLQCSNSNRVHYIEDHCVHQLAEFRELVESNCWRRRPEGHLHAAYIALKLGGGEPRPFRTFTPAA